MKFIHIHIQNPFYWQIIAQLAEDANSKSKETTIRVILRQTLTLIKCLHSETYSSDSSDSIMTALNSKQTTNERNSLLFHSVMSDAELAAQIHGHKCDKDEP